MLDKAALVTRLHSLPATAMLTPPEAAAYLNARAELLRAWRSQGRGPAYSGRLRFIRYRKGDLDAFLNTMARKRAA